MTESGPSRKRALMRSGMIVSVLLFFAKLTGLARDAGLAAVFGTGVDLQAYAVGMLASGFVTGALLVSSLSGVLVPAYSTRRDSLGERQAFSHWFALGRPLFALFLLLGGLAYVLAPWTTSLLGPGLEPQAYDLATQLSRGFALTIPISFVAGWFASLLHANRRFVEVGLRSACINIALMIGMAIWAPELGAWSLWVGTVLGNTLEILIQLPFVLRKWREVGVEATKPDVRPFLRNYAPLVSVSICLNLLTLLDRSYGTLVMSVGAAMMMYADRLVEISRALVGRTIAMVLLPELAGAPSSRDSGAVMIQRSLSVVSVLTVPMALALMLFGPSLAHWIFLGRLPVQDLRLMGDALFGLAPAAMLFAVVWVVDRVFASRGWSKYFFLFVASGVAVNWGLKAATAGTSLLWVGAGSSMGLLVTVVLSVAFLHRNLTAGILRPYYVDVLGSLMCFGAPMVAAFYAVDIVLDGAWSPLIRASLCVLASVVGIVVHWGLDFPFWSLLPERLRSPIRDRFSASAVLLRWG